MPDGQPIPFVVNRPDQFPREAGVNHGFVSEAKWLLIQSCAGRVQCVKQSAIWNFALNENHDINVMGADNLRYLLFQSLAI